MIGISCNASKSTIGIVAVGYGRFMIGIRIGRRNVFASCVLCTSSISVLLIRVVCCNIVVKSYRIFLASVKRFDIVYVVGVFKLFVSSRVPAGPPRRCRVVELLR